MKVFPYNQRNGGHRNSLCPGDSPGIILKNMKIFTVHLINEGNPDGKKSKTLPLYIYICIYDSNTLNQTVASELQSHSYMVW